MEGTSQNYMHETIKKIIFVSIITLAIIIYFNLTWLLIIANLAILLLLIYEYLSYTPPPKIKKAKPVHEFIHVYFNREAILKGGYGNLAKEITLYSPLGVRTFPYHPILLSILESYLNYPVLDETFGQEEPPLPLLGEIDASEIIVKVLGDEHRQT